MRTASAAPCLTWKAASVDVRWRPLLSVVIVTHLVTRSLAAGVAIPAVRQDSALFKKVFIDALDHVRLLILHTDIVTNHQAAQSHAINQDDSGGHPLAFG